MIPPMINSPLIKIRLGPNLKPDTMVTKILLLFLVGIHIQAQHSLMTFQTFLVPLIMMRGIRMIKQKKFRITREEIILSCMKVVGEIMDTSQHKSSWIRVKERPGFSQIRTSHQTEPRWRHPIIIKLKIIIILSLILPTLLLPSLADTDHIHTIACRRREMWAEAAIMKKEVHTARMMFITTP